MMRGRHALRLGVARAGMVAALVIATCAVFVASASAQQAGCADVTVSGEAKLDTAGSATIGPVPAPLSAGQYRIVMHSADPGHIAGHQTDQQHEQWSFRLDSGYGSPITPDLADGLTNASFDMGVVTLAEAASITFVHHGVAPSRDSVLPSVSFSCVQPTTPTSAAPTSSSTEAPVTTGGRLDPTTWAAPEPTVGVQQGSGGVGNTGGSNELALTGNSGKALSLGVLLLACGGVVVLLGRVVSIEEASRLR